MNINEVVPQKNITITKQRGFHISKHEEPTIRKQDIDDLFALVSYFSAKVYTYEHLNKLDENGGAVRIILPSVSLDITLPQLKKDMYSFRFRKVVDMVQSEMHACRLTETIHPITIPFYVNYIGVRGENDQKAQYITLHFKEDLAHTKINTSEISWRMYLFLKVLEDYKTKNKIEKIPKSVIETYIKELTIDLAYMRCIEIDFDEKEYDGINDYPTLEEWFTETGDDYDQY